MNEFGDGKSLKELIEEANNSSPKVVEEEEITEEEVLPEIPGDDVPETRAVHPVSVISLYDWFVKNSISFPHIKHIKTEISGVKSKSYLVLAAAQRELYKDGNNPEGPVDRELFLFKNADKHKLPDIPVKSLDILSDSSFSIIFLFGDDVFMRAYYTKSNLFIAYYTKLTGVPIPYHLEKYKNKLNDKLEIPMPIASTLRKGSDIINVEDLVLYYSQASKSADKIKTVRNVVDYFKEIRGDVKDVNHLWKIDTTLLKICKIED